MTTVSSALHELEKDYRYKSFISTCNDLNGTSVSCTIYRFPDDVELPPILHSTRRSGRVFFDKNTFEDFLYCPEYKISKFLISEDAKSDILEEIATNLLSEECSHIKFFFASNDGPLLFVFKVKGHIFIQLMRGHQTKAFETTFKEVFDQVFHFPLDQLFDDKVETSVWCHAFRLGDGVLVTQSIEKIIYTGAIRAFTFKSDVPGDMLCDKIHWNTELLSESAVMEQLVKEKHNFVSFAHPGGECQIFGCHYLRRISAITGYKLEELVPGVDDSLKENKMIQLAKTQFPPLLDILSLFTLCGVDTSTSNLTVRGYKHVITAKGKDAVAPLKGFYNYCAAVGENPKDRLRFQPSVTELRYVVRDIFLSGIVGDRQKERFVEKFRIAENLIYNEVPKLMGIADNHPDVVKALKLASATVVPEDPHVLLRLAKFCKRLPNGVVTTEEEIINKLTFSSTMTPASTEDWQ